jgi:hypothetical protein
MVHRIIRFDDIDGSVAAETILFALDGQTYEIDLSRANAAKLRRALTPYVEKGRQIARIPAPRSGESRRTSSGGGSARTRSELADIRAWALANGYDVAPRGSLKWEIIDAYEQEHS